jgi:glycosyltransferase involved in cell wall biosynthesis
MIPHAIDLAGYKSLYCSKINKAGEFKKPTFFYIGSLGYLPNKEAAGLLVNRIFPLLKKAYPNARLIVTGSDPHKYSQELVKNNPDIFFTGWVKDPTPYFSEADIMLVPLLRGGGVRVKLVQAFAAGIPVVSSVKGAEGMDVRDGKDILIADTPEEMAKKAIALCFDDTLRRNIIGSAFEYVRSRHSYQEVERMICQALAGE